MKIVCTFVMAACVLAIAAPAHAGAFSFNKAPAEKMVNDCKEEGVELTMEQAEAIVKARETKRFAYVSDLKGILPPRKIAELDPIEEDNDLIFNPNAMPGMKPY